VAEYPALRAEERDVPAICEDRGALTTRLHDTKSGSLQELRPRSGQSVGIYACGPTVYNRIHIGNARPFVVFSQLKRFLEHEGLDVTLVANITDVNDKIYDAARPLNVPSAELAAEMTAHYIADTDGLGLGRPDAEPLASTSIEPIIAYIQALIDRDAAYAVEGDVYFRVRADPEYGSLSHRSIDDMDQGEGIEGARRKQDPLDFALWKAQKEDEDAAWDSPWGPGRPGWHIECSAMAEEALGTGIEIHGGGNDLTFPHHENEAAQTRMARGEELAQIWMHNGMLQMGAEKMAKSVGNVALLHEVLAAHGRDAVLMYFSGGHYRQPLAFDDAAMEQAAARVRRVRDAGRRLVDGPRTWPPSRSASSRRCATTSTRRRRWPPPSNGSGRRTRARTWAATTSRRCSASWGSRTCSPPTRRRPAPRIRRCCAPARTHGPARTSPRPTACATRCARVGGRSATGPRGPSSCRSGDRLRAQRRHRGAARQAPGARGRRHVVCRPGSRAGGANHVG
jgi:cysteinyl-tRNA synthetase